VFFVVAMQTAVAYAMGTYNVHWAVLLVTAYWLGGFANHNLFLAVHELAHGLAFESPLANRCLGLVANFPTIFPFAVTFQKYHLEHHQHQGVDNIDMDIPTYWEVRRMPHHAVALRNACSTCEADRDTFAGSWHLMHFRRRRGPSTRRARRCGCRARSAPRALFPPFSN
jgi:fatty acid desaturase